MLIHAPVSNDIISKSFTYNNIAGTYNIIINNRETGEKRDVYKRSDGSRVTFYDNRNTLCNRL